MSEMEHDQKTEEMFEVVNSHASDESRRLEDQVIKKMQEEKDASAQAKKDQEKAAWRRERRIKAVCSMIIRLLVCAISAALFVAALLLPSWVPVLCFVGIGVCSIIGSVVTDRCIRDWRRSW